MVLAIADENGVRLLLEELLELSRSEIADTRKSAIMLLSAYCVKTKVDLSPHIGTLLKGLILLMTDTDQAILRYVAEAITAVLKVRQL